MSCEYHTTQLWKVGQKAAAFTVKWVLRVRGLNRNTDPTFLYISQDTSDIIPKYVPETNMPLKCYICQLLQVQISDNYVSIYTQ